MHEKTKTYENAAQAIILAFFGGGGGGGGVG